MLLVRSQSCQLAAWLASMENHAVCPNEVENALFCRIAVELEKLELWMML